MSRQLLGHGEAERWQSIGGVIGCNQRNEDVLDAGDAPLGGDRRRPSRREGRLPGDVRRLFAPPAGGNHFQFE